MASLLALSQRPILAVEDANSSRDKGAAPNSAQIVYVERSLGWSVYDGAESRSPTLFRELARQALLIAARDELGLATRDVWLASEAPRAGDNAPFELIATTQNDSLSLRITRGFGDQQTVALVLPIQLKNLGADAPEFAASMEAASRTSFVDLLKQAGFRDLKSTTDRPAIVGEQSEPLDRIESQLDELNEYSQFSALRALHAAIRARGETPRLLGQLVRGYAQLGVLTELCWAPTHKVFKARALLYAQRMTQKYPSADSLDHLAFAEALTGLPAAALETLANANAAQAAAMRQPGDLARQAPWRGAIDAYCRIDTEILAKMAEDSDAQLLASFLQFLALEQSDCDTLTMEFGLNLVRTTMPDCFRVFAGLNRIAGVGLGHFATERAPATFASGFRKNLLRLPGLPDSVSQSLGEPLSDDELMSEVWRQEAAGITALLAFGKSVQPRHDRAAADGGERPPDAANLAALDEDNELRWETLGLLLREVSWEQVWRRIRFLNSMLGVSPNDWLKLARPLIDLHPYHEFLQIYRWDSKNRQAVIAALGKNKPVGIELPAAWLGIELSNYDQVKGQEFTQEAFNNSDDTAFELAQVLNWTNQANLQVPRAQRLLAVSPHSPIAQAVLVARAFNEVEDRAKVWEKAAGRHPRLAIGLAKHYLAERDTDHAEILLRPAAKLSHEKEAYLQLAGIYKRQGKEARWLATLEEYLEQPSFGLEHAQVQVQIADHFIAKKEWADAKPYADAAAQTYAGWGLYKAAYVHEALREWELAENYYQAVAKRYRGEEMCWYLFCKRSGHGKVTAARDLAAAAIESGNARFANLEIFYQVDKQFGRAIDEIAKSREAQSGQGPFYLMEIALLADRDKQIERRDATLAKLVEPLAKIKAPPGAPKAIVRDGYAGLAELFKEDLKKGGQVAFNLAEVEKCIPEQDVYTSCCYHWFIGCYLERCGKSDAAIEQWKRCLACPTIDYGARTLAGAALVEHEVDEADYENPLVNPKLDASLLENAGGKSK